jgi:hypothetical protein
LYHVSAPAWLVGILLLAVSYRFFPRVPELLLRNGRAEWDYQTCGAVR